MLYITTRNQDQTYPPERALSEDRSPDGGFYVPARMPRFDRQQILALRDRSFAGNVASLINLLFDTNLDSWAVEFAIGRYPVNLVSISGRATVAETWHNPAWRFTRLVQGIEKAIRQSDQISQTPTDWLMIAARTAVLFGIFGQLLREGEVSFEEPMDVAVSSGNFSGLMAAWYGREWGLPIGNIICASNENPAAWNLLHKGELKTDAIPVRTETPDCDVAVPLDLERLIFHTLGPRETERFLQTCAEGSNYYLERFDIDRIRKGIQVSVVSAGRMEATVAGIHRSSNYIADPYTALIYSGLIDCRSRGGMGRHTLILSEESPAFSLGLLSRCLNMTPGELKKRLDKA